MKTPEEWFEIYQNTRRYGIKDLVKDVQIDAYNEAINSAMEECFVIYSENGSYNVCEKEDILKLKK